MGADKEQRACMKFCFLLGKTPAEAVSMLVEAFKENALSQSEVGKWYSRFERGDMSLEDQPESGQPSTSENELDLDEVCPVIDRNHGNHHPIVDELSEETDPFWNSCQRILTEDLQSKCTAVETPPTLFIESETNNNHLNVDERGPNFTTARKYSIKFKLQVVAYSRKFSIHKTSRQYHINRKTIRDWQMQEGQLQQKLKLEKVDDEVLEFYQFQQEKKLQVSQEDLKTKAMEIFGQMVKEGVATADEFEPSEDWAKKLVKRNKLNVDQGNASAQKIPTKYVEEYLGFLKGQEKVSAPSLLATKKDSEEPPVKDPPKVEDLK